MLVHQRVYRNPFSASRWVARVARSERCHGLNDSTAESVPWAAKSARPGEFFVFVRGTGWSVVVEWWVGLPGLVNIQKTMENHHAINGKIHYKWAIFNSLLYVYQRVSSNILCLDLGNDDDRHGPSGEFLWVIDKLRMILKMSNIPISHVSTYAAQRSFSENCSDCQIVYRNPVWAFMFARLKI